MMPGPTSTVEQKWMLSGVPERSARLDAFLAAPLRSARTYTPEDGTQVLRALVAGLAPGVAPAVVLAAAEPHLGTRAARLCAQLRQDLAAGAPLARALSAHPDAFGAGLGSALEAMTSVLPLPDALRAAADAHDSAQGARERDVQRRAHLWALAGAAVLAAVVSTLLLSSLPAGWQTYLVHVVQALTVGVCATAGLTHATARRGPLGGAGRRLLDPTGAAAKHISAHGSLRVLAAALEAGTSARRAAELAAGSARDEWTARSLRDVAGRLWSGQQLPAALGAHPQLLDVTHLSGATTAPAQAAALRRAASTTRPLGWHHLVGPGALTTVAWVLTLAAAAMA